MKSWWRRWRSKGKPVVEVWLWKGRDTANLPSSRHVEDKGAAKAHCLCRTVCY